MCEKDDFTLVDSKEELLQDFPEEYSVILKFAKEGIQIKEEVVNGVLGSDETQNRPEEVSAIDYGIDPDGDEAAAQVFDLIDANQYQGRSFDTQETVEEVVNYKSNQPMLIGPAGSGMLQLVQASSSKAQSVECLGGNDENQSYSENRGKIEILRLLLDPSGMQETNHCNCKKPKCLLLLCPCLQIGKLCYVCNCMNCCNNLTNEEDRKRAIKLVLEKCRGSFRSNFEVFQPLVQMKKYSEGCRCERSRCVKNYCKCYKANVFCAGTCKCTGCGNSELVQPLGFTNGVGVKQHFAGSCTCHSQISEEGSELRLLQRNQIMIETTVQKEDGSRPANIGIMNPPVRLGNSKSLVSKEVTSKVESLLQSVKAAEKEKLEEVDILRQVILKDFRNSVSATYGT